MRLAVLITATTALGLAAESRVSGPSLGYVLDKDTNAVRRIAGIAGSSTFDTPLAVDDFRPLAVSSVAGYAVGTSSNGAVSIVRFKTLDRFTVDSAASSPDSAVASPSGSAILLYWKDENRIQVLSGFPDAPALSYAAVLPGEPSLLAVNDAGGQALAVVHGEDGDTLYGATGDAVTALQRSARMTAAEYASHGTDVFFTDSAALYRVREGNIERIADADSAIALAADKKAVLLARDKTVTVVNLSDLTATDIPCGCPVSTIKALNGTVFRVSDTMNAPMWILDLGATDPAFYFIPQAGGSNE